MMSWSNLRKAFKPEAIQEKEAFNRHQENPAPLSTSVQTTTKKANHPN